MRLHGKSIVVTGAGSGIGAGIAKLFGEQGAKLIVNDINTAGGERVTAEINQAGGTARFVHGDVTKAADWERVVSAALSAHGRLDSVINNAGWTYTAKSTVLVTDAEFDKTFAINVKSILLAAQHAIPIYQKQGGGNFVNIASTAGVRPRPNLGVYNASKAAVINLSKSLAVEFGPANIRVNCVNPVFNPDTALSSGFAGGTVDDAAKARFRATIPMGRFSTALDVAQACLYLASDEASLVSGVCLEVDGARCV
ncbi:MAG: SDR family oxidoreductase [Burkholderiales bacterium]